VLANAAAYWGAYDLSQQLNEAMQSRAVIEQAKGMLMAQSPGMTPDDAFDMLRAASQRENVKLRAVAQRIVDERVSRAGSEKAPVEGSAASQTPERPRTRPVTSPYSANSLIMASSSRRT